MIEFTSGDMFSRPFDMRVNTVNCVGVMGAGVALAFKERYPEMFREYKRECDLGNVGPGKLHIWKTLQGDWIVNFPTKRHWREKSRYEDIEVGLKALRRYLEKLGEVSVGLPALGCGHGGLDWNRVSNLIRQYLEDIPAKIFVFAPQDSRAIGEKAKRESHEWTQAELNSANIFVLDINAPQFPSGLRRINSSIFFKGAREIWEGDSIAIMPSRSLLEREFNATKMILHELSNNSVVLDLPLTGAAIRHIAEVACSEGVKIIVWIAEGLLVATTPDWLENLLNTRMAIVASIASPKTRYYSGAAQGVTQAAASAATAVVVTDPEPYWISATSWQLEHQVKNSFFYVNYADSSDCVRNFWRDSSATPIGKRAATGRPDLGPVMATLRQSSIQSSIRTTMNLTESRNSHCGAEESVLSRNHHFHNDSAHQDTTTKKSIESAIVIKKGTQKSKKQRKKSGQNHS